MFSFSPKTDAEIAAMQNQGLLEEGVYKFTVKHVEQCVSQSDNSMLKIRLSVFEKSGGMRVIFDYLVATDRMMFKLKHFCESIGLQDKYTDGKFNPQECVNRSGYAYVSIQKGSARPDGLGNYPDKNQIKDYVLGDAAEDQKKKYKDFDDDVKF